MDIVDIYTDFKAQINQLITLVAVSKTKPEEDILKLYNVGHKVFGENKVQELNRKYQNLPKDVNWHFIGHLQTNKVKIIAPYISVIHSVDSVKILKEINYRANLNNRIIKCLLQFHVAKEDAKFGLKEADIPSFFESINFNELTNVEIIGIMGMATYTTDKELITSEFKQLNEIFKRLKVEYFANNVSFTEISMGMSNDYKIAIAQGATMIRIGSTIFGER
ncbi:MAG: YggS family pyridoxal phosphate-dependent enzyme [Bacteroidales bacterium]|nr:YggS family pyridoxal phosphate-dependent enzyme [Bacteroidales bacterium]